jgi:hypothetical protein
MADNPAPDKNSPQPALESIFTKILSSVSQLKDISVQQIASMFKSGMHANLAEMSAAKRVMEHSGSGSIGCGIESLESIVSSYMSGAEYNTFAPFRFSGQQYSPHSFQEGSSPYFPTDDMMAAYQADIVWDSPLGKKILDDISGLKKIIPRTDLKVLKDGTSITDIYNVLKERLSSIESKMIKLGVKADDPVAKTLSSIKDNVKAQEQLSKNQMCFQIPIMYNQKPSSLNVYVFDKRKTGKGGRAGGDFSISLNLETESLGNLDIDITVTDIKGQHSQNVRKAQQAKQTQQAPQVNQTQQTQQAPRVRQIQQAQQALKQVDLEIAVKDRTVKRYLDTIKENLGDRINEAGFRIGSIVCDVKSKPQIINSEISGRHGSDATGDGDSEALGLAGSFAAKRALGKNSSKTLSGVDYRI